MSSAVPSFKTEFVDDGGWRIIVASGMGVGLGLSALPFYTIGVFATSLEAEFGWTRAEVMLSTFFMMLANLVAGWAVGLMVDRLGVRKVALVGQVGLAIGMCLLGLVTGSLWTQYLAWFLMAFFGLGTLPVTWTRGIATWFDKGRGLAMGIALMGTGLAGYGLTKFTPNLIEALGWRQAYFALGLLVPVIAMPLVISWFREKPSASGLRPHKDDLPGYSVKEILKNYRFWLMMLAFACVSFGVGGLLPNLVPLLESKDLTKADAAGYAALIGIAVIGGRVVAGWMLDRIWAPFVALIFLTVPAAACFFLTGDVTSGTMIGLSAVLIGLSAGAEFDLIAYMCTRYFGLKNYGLIYALQYMSFGLFSGLAPAIFGNVYDNNGTYDPILGITAMLFIIGPLLLLGLGRYPTLPNDAAPTR